MSHKDGAYLGGIRTVEHMRQRCSVDEVTGCWHWGLSMVQGSPKVWYVDSDGNRKCGRGRRIALELVGGIKPGQTAFAKDKCKSDDCVNPDHCQAGTRAAAGAAITRSGRWKNHPKKMAASRETAKKRRKLTDEQRAEIRMRTESNKKLAAEYGVSQYAIWVTKRGRKTDGMSVFNLGCWL